jgi:ABC-type multidrug transport system fused ATPase/permease subunit
MPRYALRGSIAIVLQDSFIFSRSVEENIRLGAPLDSDRVRRVARMVQADEFIERLPAGYGEIMAERGATLSTGQKQLLSFARAIAHNPSILVLDEATANIDTVTEQKIQASIQQISQDRTTIFIAHRLSTIRNSNCIYVLSSGRIVEYGCHDLLIEQGGLYRKLYEAQFDDDAVAG